jgi:hypothetical protein
VPKSDFPRSPPKKVKNGALNKDDQGEAQEREQKKGRLTEVDWQSDISKY